MKKFHHERWNSLLCIITKMEIDSDLKLYNMNYLFTVTCCSQHVALSLISSVKIQLLTYSTEQSPSWEANRFSSSQETPCILWNLKVHNHIHNRLSFFDILSQSAWSPNNLWHIKSHPCWYFWWQIFNKYHSELSSDDMLFILSFMKTVQLVSVISEFESEWGQTEPYSLLCYSYGSEEQGIYGTWTCKQERNPCVILRYIQVW
jgi:hypothetical protein